MRRKDREVTDFNRIIEIIDECNILRIGLADGDFPYIVPVNFAYTVNDNEICFYIHGAMAGRKYEMLKKNPNCSFEMDLPLKMDCLVKDKDVTMRYKSVMGKCKVEYLEGDEKQSAIDDVIMARYDETRNFDYDRETVKRTAVAKLTVIEISAKVNPLSGGADA
ncbi:MAG: pyridoxamine 5'-phosphate oxidase family protein [Lachnospiraceae bacterium]|nr:pyridoxamine 5'-phosphate oxidase family protein [Lachnospiraceae bacterium]